MLVDSYFQQGVGHEVCEDYALHGDKFAIVSDGCSNYGGPRIDTDWGARFLCKATEDLLLNGSQPAGGFFSLVGEKAKEAASYFPNLTPQCLTATLLVLQSIDSNYQVSMIGDGVVGGRRKDGRWKIHVVSFPRGPFYLKYKIFQEEQNFVNAFGSSFTIETYFGKLAAPELSVTPNYAERCEIWSQTMTRTEQNLEINLEDPMIQFEFPKEDYDLAFVSSDGIESFQQIQATATQKRNETIHVLDALRVAADFVTMIPGFARLQRNWVFRQDKPNTFLRMKWKNDDDVSMGVIYE